jgi:Holliday junction resolvasome RuvABC endonuclease subunit
VTRCLGIDPGYANLGLAVVEDRKATWSGKATTKPGDFRERMIEIRRAIRDALDEHKPDVVAVESQEGAQVGNTQRGTTNASAARVREVVQAIYTLAEVRGIRVVEVSPRTWKRCLGLSGKSKGRQVKLAARAILGVTWRTCQHQDDALGVALAGRRA